LQQRFSLQPLRAGLYIAAAGDIPGEDASVLRKALEIAGEGNWSLSFTRTKMQSVATGKYFNMHRSHGVHDGQRRGNDSELRCPDNSFFVNGLCRIALGKETYSDFDMDELRRLMPVQNGSAALNIANVCRRLLEKRTDGRLSSFYHGDSAKGV